VREHSCIPDSDDSATMQRFAHRLIVVDHENICCSASIARSCQAQGEAKREPSPFGLRGKSRRRMPRRWSADRRPMPMPADLVSEKRLEIRLCISRSSPSRYRDLHHRLLPATRCAREIASFGGTSPIASIALRTRLSTTCSSGWHPQHAHAGASSLTLTCAASLPPAISMASRSMDARSCAPRGCLFVHKTGRLLIIRRTLACWQTCSRPGQSLPFASERMPAGSQASSWQWRQAAGSARAQPKAISPMVLTRAAWPNSRYAGAPRLGMLARRDVARDATGAITLSRPSRSGRRGSPSSTDAFR